MKTLAQWCFRHRSVVIVAWLVLLIGLVVGGKAIGGASYADAFSLPGNRFHEGARPVGEVGALGLR